MIHLLLILLFLCCLGITGAWLAENPGSVTIHWFNYRIDTSFAFLLAMALASAVILAYGWILIRRIMLAPAHFSERRNLKHYKKALTEITWSVAALTASAPEEAKAHTRRAEKLVGRTPLTLLLSAQIARSSGDDVKTHLLLEEMLGHKETEYLAARYLSEAASKNRQLPAALALAERAHTLNPAHMEALISLQLRLGRWQEAQLAITQAARKGKISKADLRRWRGLVTLEQGRELLDNNNSEAALTAGRRALKLLPKFPPALLFAASAFAANGHSRKADKLRRAVPARYSAWACSLCGHNAPQWQAYCPACDALDTLK